MKKIVLILFLFILSTGCQVVENTNSNPEFEKPKTEQSERANYMGSWFEIKYPSEFLPNPSGPIEIWEDIKYIETDEASFSSPNAEVEFFVFSPQWAGDPKDYLQVKENEEILSQENKEEGIKRTSTTIFKDKNGKYFRKSESITETLGDTVLHLVFGIKYQNEEIFTKYEEDYNSFKASLVQFAD